MGLSLKLEEEFVSGVLGYNSCGGWDRFWKAPDVDGVHDSPHGQVETTEGFCWQ